MIAGVLLLSSLSVPMMTVNHVTSIYDADTISVNISAWPDIVGRSMPVRVDGFDAPEIRGQCEGEKALAQLARQVTVTAIRSATVMELRNIRRGKYFRLVAEVWLDGRNLADILIESGYARPYHGGHREGWCP